MKALYRDAQVLILDEPTAVLAPQEVDELFGAIRSLVKQGRTVIFIAHKLPEVLAIADNITILRQGRSIGTMKATDVSEKSLATLMVGRDVAIRIDRADTSKAQRLVISGLRVINNQGSEAVAGIDLTVKAGEVVGLVGVEGNGQAETLEAIAGLRPVRAGVVQLDDEVITPLGVRDRRRRGISLIPEDRIAQGLAVDANVAENLIATKLDDIRFVKRGVVDKQAIAQAALELISTFGIAGASPSAPVGALSGGNMQKVVVARELGETPRLLLVNQPTRGVDLGAMEFIWKAIVGVRDTGAAVLLTSTDLSEVLALSDRLVVFYRGKIVAAFVNSPDLTPETLGSYMLGLSAQ